jgi:hypothetical protein
MKRKVGTKAKASTAIVKVEGEILSPSPFAEMSSETLANRCIRGAVSARRTALMILELRQRFDNLRDGQTIHGYRRNQWLRFCKMCLNMTPRNARYLIASTGEENPASKHDGSAKRNGPPPPWSPTAMSPEGNRWDLVISALQGYVRDGNEGEAVKLVLQLYAAGYRVWPRLRAYAEEEAGLSAIDLTLMIGGLEATAKEIKDDRSRDLLCVIKATMLICRAKKSRACDNAIHWWDVYEGEVPTNREVKMLAASTEPPVAIPDKAKDIHTAEGRKMKRGMKQFVEEKATLQNESDVAPFQPPTEGTKACPRCWGTGRVPI